MEGQWSITASSRGNGAPAWVLRFRLVLQDALRRYDLTASSALVGQLVGRHNGIGLYDDGELEERIRLDRKPGFISEWPVEEFLN